MQAVIKMNKIADITEIYVKKNKGLCGKHLLAGGKRQTTVLEQQNF